MESEEKIRNLQILEQSLHNLMMQKQAFQMELAETNAALKEIQNSTDDVYKIISQLMIKVRREEVKKELEEKKRLFDLRIQSIEKQEQEFEKRADSLRKDVFKTTKK
jgi:prefoldin beta subunit